MAGRIPVGCYFTAAQYRALARLAAERSTPERPVQAHHLIEELVARALTRHAESPRDMPAAPPVKPIASAVSTPRPAAAPPAAGRGRRSVVDREVLRKLHADDMTDRAMAEVLGVTKETVRWHRNAMDLRPNVRPRSTVDVARLRELHAQNLNDHEIAKAMHISRETVGYYRRERLNLPKNTAVGRKRTKGVDAA